MTRQTIVAALASVTLLCFCFLVVGAIVLRGAPELLPSALRRDTADREASGPGFARVNDPAPDFSLRALDGQTVRLSDLRGRPVIINFWATWCPPCRAEMPALQAASERFAPDGLVILAVNVEESETVVRPFVRELGLTFPILLDTTGSLSRPYRIRSLPTSFFITRDGVIREQFTGEMNQSVIDRRVNAIR